MSSSIHIRAATSEDYDFFVEIWPELGIDDPLIGAQQFVDEIVPDAWIAEIDDCRAGYLYARSLLDTGYVVQLIVSPAHRRCGVARSLLHSIADRFVGRGLDSWSLNVKPDNHGAVALYRSLGFEPAYESRALRFSWDEVEQWSGPSVAVTIDTPGPDDDRELEEALAMAEGTLASRRKNPRFVLRGLKQGQHWVACAAFNPSHPGAYPFKVARPELALPLLTALRDLATEPGMQIVAEDDPALVEHLLERGARDHLRILHMRGPLPLRPGAR